MRVTTAFIGAGHCCLWRWFCCFAVWFCFSMAAFSAKRELERCKSAISFFLILAVASLGLWGNSAATKDEDAEAKAVLEEYIKEEMDGKVLFLNLTEVPRSFYQNPSADAPYYDAQDYDWRYYNVSFYYEDQQDKEASGIIIECLYGEGGCRSGMEGGVTGGIVSVDR